MPINPLYGYVPESKIKEVISKLEKTRYELQLSINNAEESKRSEKFTKA